MRIIPRLLLGVITVVVIAVVAGCTVSVDPRVVEALRGTTTTVPGATTATVAAASGAAPAGVAAAAAAATTAATAPPTTAAPTTTAPPPPPADPRNEYDCRLWFQAGGVVTVNSNPPAPPWCVGIIKGRLNDLQYQFDTNNGVYDVPAANAINKVRGYCGAPLDGTVELTIFLHLLNKLTNCDKFSDDTNSLLPPPNGAIQSSGIVEQK